MRASVTVEGVAKIKAWRKLIAFPWGAVEWKMSVSGRGSLTGSWENLWRKGGWTPKTPERMHLEHGPQTVGAYKRSPVRCYHHHDNRYVAAESRMSVHSCGTYWKDGWAGGEEPGNLYGVFTVVVIITTRDCERMERGGIDVIWGGGGETTTMEKRSGQKSALWRERVGRWWKLVSSGWCNKEN